MDFERAAIKALFYDYPVESFLKELDNPNGKSSYMELLPELVRWRDHAFTETEARLTREILEHKWMAPSEEMPQTVREMLTPFPKYHWVFMAVQHVASQMLEDTPVNLRPNPIINFEDLFRWKDITAYVGEDILTTAFIATEDIKKHRLPSNLYLWQDTIHHNNDELNHILDAGMSDIHAHFNATTDIFHLNWINLMNGVAKATRLRKIKHYQDLAVISPRTKAMIPLETLCYAAAYLRVYLYKVLMEQLPGKDIDNIDVLRLAQDSTYAMACRRKIQGFISTKRASALKMSTGEVLDYLIRPSHEVNANLDNIGMIYQGERQLLYSFFRRYFLYDYAAWALAPQMYLYLLIKSHIRREFVQINLLKGFNNFQEYQGRKELFVDKNDPMKKVWGRLVSQTTISGEQDHIEARLTPKSVLMEQYADYRKSIFSDKECERFNNMSFVAHFIKPEDQDNEWLRKMNERDGRARFAYFRKKMQRELNQILDLYERQQKHLAAFNTKWRIPVVGIDAASNEIFCRPEVFGHVYRYAKQRGLLGRTFHVGEDFLDVVDGLRAIDEAVLFLNLDKHSRIGHALALGVDVAEYYEKRRYNIVMPKQYLLDDCVWLYMRAMQNNISIPKEIEQYLLSTAACLYTEIYDDVAYGHWDIWTYWNSMLLRGNDPEEDETSSPDFSLKNGRWKCASFVTDDEVKTARRDSNAQKLYKAYQFSGEVKHNGNERYSSKWPKRIAEVVGPLQVAMQRDLVGKDITVECNPTSNIKIGHFEKYEEHPLLTHFDPIEKKNDAHYPILNCSINTDDRGVFATSLYYEYSLIALALLKQKEADGTDKYNHRVVYDYIERMRKNAEIKKFAKQTI